MATDPRFCNPDGTIKTGDEFLRALLGAYPERVITAATVREAVEGGFFNEAAKAHMEKAMADPTTGERLVRRDFNPNANPLVDEIKRRSAELIDLMETHRDKDQRLAALAITAYETAAMWAVKMATAEPQS